MSKPLKTLLEAIGHRACLVLPRNHPAFRRASSFERCEYQLEERACQRFGRGRCLRCHHVRVMHAATMDRHVQNEGSRRQTPRFRPGGFSEGPRLEHSRIRDENSAFHDETAASTGDPKQ
jgi:hypothetical protein